MARTETVPSSPPSFGRYVIGSIVVALKVLRVIAVVLVIVVGGAGIGAWVSVSKVLPDTRNLGEYRPQQTTKLFSREGELLGELHVENREVVPLSRIPTHMRQATIAIEDARFYRHVGADPKGILRAAYANYQSGDYAQGGSTITEQLAKNIYLSRQKTLSRRFQQMLLALQIERQYSKDEILEFYLNEVCYGHNCFGVQAASRYFLGKPVEKVTVAEAALLAGLPRAPTRYSPYNHPEAARARRDLVLSKMAEYGYLTFDEAVRAKREEVHLADPKLHRSKTKFRAPYFTTVAVRELVERYGVELAYKGGLRVTTTLSLPLAVKAYEITKKRMREYAKHHATQCALVCLDPKTGEILTLVGGTNWEDEKGGEWNRATQAVRQPGSSFKPYVYAAALEAGYRPTSTVIDAPVSYPDGPGKVWKPRNYDGKYRGKVTLQTALALSINIPAVKVNVKVGPAKVAALAHRLGIRTELQPVKSLALGSCGVTVLDHVSAYGAFATGGIRARPTTILEVRDAAGTVLDRHVPQRSFVLSRQTAKMLTDMLINAVEHGTGKRARIPGIKVAGKTGTTSNSRDVWFIGYTPDLVTGVWIGNDDNSPMRGRGVAGGLLCAPLWKEFMIDALKVHGSTGKFVEVKIDPVEAPDVDTLPEEEVTGVQAAICTETGMRATTYCPSVSQRLFPEGTALPGVCQAHGRARVVTPREGGGGEGESAPRTVTVTLCGVSGRLATPLCTPTRVVAMPSDQVPRAYCGLHTDSGPGEDTGSQPVPVRTNPAPPTRTPPAAPPVGESSGRSETPAEAPAIPVAVPGATP